MGTHDADEVMTMVLRRGCLTQGEKPQRGLNAGRTDGTRWWRISRTRPTCPSATTGCWETGAPRSGHRQRHCWLAFNLFAEPLLACVQSFCRASPVPKSFARLSEALLSVLACLHIQEYVISRYESSANINLCRLSELQTSAGGLQLANYSAMCSAACAQCIGRTRQPQ